MIFVVWNSTSQQPEAEDHGRRTNLLFQMQSPMRSLIYDFKPLLLIIKLHEVRPTFRIYLMYRAGSTRLSPFCSIQVNDSCIASCVKLITIIL